MVCESCGATVGEDDAFCNSCGAPTGRGHPVQVGVFPPPVPETRAETDDADAESDAAVPAGQLAPPDHVDDRRDEALVSTAAASVPDDPDATAPLRLTDPPTDEATVVGSPDTEPDPWIWSAPAPAGSAAVTTTVETLPPPSPVTDEVPMVFDGHGDLEDYPPPRDPFRIRLVFIFAVFCGVATVLTPAANLIDIRTTRPVDGITTGPVTLDDVGTNLAIAAFVGIGAMVVGGFVACWGFRWAAGLAGGSGLAIIGWSALVVGLLEARIARAEQVTRESPIGFTLEITRDLGYWLVVTAAGLGALVFLASLRLSGTAARPGLNPWIAAIGAVSVLVLAVGPLLPVGDDASFTDNFRSTDATGDLPALYFVGRLTQVGLIGVGGAIGFLLVRRYGLGLVAGSITVAFWLWYSSLAELGDDPLGIAAGNFGAPDTTPHAVTTVGMVLTLAMLLAAIIAALVQRPRVRYRRKR